MSRMTRAIVAVLATYAAGLVGLLFVDAQVSAWYAALIKPLLTPSASLFAIVWLILYGFMAASLALVWTRYPRPPHVEGWIRYYFVQLLFNATWTVFFFSLHAILLAFIDILFLIFIVTALIAGGVEIDRRVAYLLTPYLLWLLFAGYLNLTIWFLN